MNVTRWFLAMDPLPDHTLIWRQDGDEQQTKGGFRSPALCRLGVVPPRESWFASCLTACLFLGVLSGKAHQEPK